MLKEFYTLSNGTLIPKIGLGTYQMKGVTCKSAVISALAHGYIHIDSAIYYQNHDVVGEAISSYPRSSLFITSKIPPYLQGYASTMQATLDTLSQLQTPYLDLMLIHWPGVAGKSLNDPEIVNLRHESWKALEDLYDQGKVKAIGVSNFLEMHLTKLLESCRIKPHVNQFEYHPWCHDDSLVNFCNRHGIVVEAYSSLARALPELWDNSQLQSMSHKYSKSKAQILLRWGLQKNCVILPKSVSPERIFSNADLNFEISQHDMQALDSFHCNRRTCWDPNTVLV